MVKTKDKNSRQPQIVTFNALINVLVDIAIVIAIDIAIQIAIAIAIALWARISKNTDWSTGLLAYPLAHSLAQFARSLTLLTPSLVGQ